MIRQIVLLAVVLAAPAVTRAQARTALYAEALGPTGAYALGVEQTVFRADRTQFGVRAGVSYSIESKLLPGDPDPHVLAIPVAALIRVPVARVGRAPVSIEAEGGATLARPYGLVTRFFLSPGQTFGVSPHAMASVRADLFGNRMFVRAGLTMGGVGRAGEITPAASIGLGL